MRRVRRQCLLLGRVLVILSALVGGLSALPKPVDAADLTSANFRHRAGSVVPTSAAGRVQSSTQLTPEIGGHEGTVSATPVVAPSGSAATLRSWMPGFWPIVVGGFSDLDLDLDGEQFFLDDDDDGDGLLDTVETGTEFFVSELNTGTSPVLSDSDRDGFLDGIEILLGTDPTDPASFPATPQVPLTSAAFRWLLVGLLLSAATWTGLRSSRRTEVSK